MWTTKVSDDGSIPPAIVTPRRNSRFVPEAERGWHPAPPPPTSASRSQLMRRSSSGASKAQDSGSGSFLDIRRPSWSHLAARLNSPRLAMKRIYGEASSHTPNKGSSRSERNDDEGDDDEEEEDDDEDDDEDEDEDDASVAIIEEEDGEEENDLSLLRSHTRERSNSVPDLSLMASSSDSTRQERRDTARSRPRIEHRPSSKGVPLLVDLQMLRTQSRNHPLSRGPPLTPSQLTRQNSITPSLDLQRTRSQHPSRGYDWQPHPDGRRHHGHVPPSHRNPTAMQAFYDTHFGSSSGFRSVAGLADDIFHPLDSAKQVLSKLSVVNGTKRGESKGLTQTKTPHESMGTPPPTATTSTMAKEERDSLMSWRTMLFSPAIFGMGGTPSSQHSHPHHYQQRQEQQQITTGAVVSAAKQAAGRTQQPSNGAYVPELIPTVQRDPHAKRYFKRLEGNVVVLGGYRGSILRDAATHQMIWVPLKVGVGLRRPTLELGLGEAAEERSEDLVVADGMLAGVGNMVDTGRRLIARCTRKRTKVFNWGYDWRLSLARSSERLETFLSQLWLDSAEREEDRRGAKVVAHSMGGLVALHALVRTRNPRIFDALVFASTPFLGCANILGPLQFGDAALWNDEICSPRATFSFRSSFYLLPVDPSNERAIDTRGGRCFEEEDGRPHDVDFLDPQTWDDLGLSPCVKRGGRKAYLQKAQQRADHQNTSLGHQLEQSASRQAPVSASQPISHMDPDKDLADGVPGFPGADLQMKSPEWKGEGGVRGARSEAIKMGQAIAGEKEDTKETLQAANRQADARVERDASAKAGGAAKEDNDDGDDDDDDDDDDEHNISWAYLEKTLAETRQFFHELRTGFKQEHCDESLYPPIALLTSGRTPTVRGALVWPPGHEALTKQEAKIDQAATGDEATTTTAQPPPTVAADGPKDHWKRTARLRDYSRMLYAPGDGVILRRSATTLPGRWGELLVRGAASVDEHGENALTNEEGVVETSHRHVTLLSDVDGIGRCLEACRRARVNGLKSSAASNSNKLGIESS